MAFTYGGDPAADTRSEVRFLVGDTIDLTSSGLSLTDAEIDHLLTQYGNTLLAAHHAALALQARYSTQADFRKGKTAVSAGQRAKALRILAADLLAKASVETVRPWAGGQSISEKEALAADTDAVQPRFTRGRDSIFQGIGNDPTTTGRFFED